MQTTTEPTDKEVEACYIAKDTYASQRLLDALTALRDAEEAYRDLVAVSDNDYTEMGNEYWFPSVRWSETIAAARKVLAGHSGWKEGNNGA